jgi:hypothetical protein
MYNLLKYDTVLTGVWPGPYKKHIKSQKLQDSET